MAVREFNGVTTTGDYLEFDNGAVGAINNGSIAYSMLILMKPLERVNVDPYFAIGRSSSQNLAAMYYPASSTLLALGDDDPGNDLSANVGLTQDDWQILGATKAAGTAAARLHRKVLGSGSWTHVDTGSAVSSSGAAATLINIARFASGSNERSYMRAAVAAIWQSVLSDANFVTIESTASTAGIQALSPTWLVELNQTDVTTTILDLTSGDGDQTARVGTTVVTTDDPAWTFSGITTVPHFSTSYIGAIGP